MTQPIAEIGAGASSDSVAAALDGYAPVILRGLVRDWPVVAAGAVSSDTLVEYLAGFDRGGVAEAFVGPPSIRGRFFYSPDLRGFNFERRRGAFGELLRYILGLAGKPEVPSVYAGAVETARTLPGFAAANSLPLAEARGGTPRIWVGNASIISTHFDASDNIACVAAGQRRFTLFPPDQVHNLYVGPFDHTVAGQPTSMVDLKAPDFDRYPRFRDALAAAQTAELGPGDALYIPALWWHQVEALSDVNVLVNYWWEDSPDMAARLEAMVYAVLTIGSLPPERRASWQAMFDTFVFKHHGEPAAHLAPEQRGILAEPTPRLRQYIRSFLARGLGRP
ncbi:cupin-like domain-containing protein [Sphingomonas sp. MMS12-HWE2-04]|uniref:cupin-like domain-containing protein n=1 Tax=Sphingomonas sp. MMS12-HWE2-04 TaxID=3234199 RepID=UPI00384F0187